MDPLFVQVKLYNRLREIAGKDSLKLKLKAGATVRDALDLLASNYGDGLNKRLSRRNHWVIMVNDRNVHYLDDLKTALRDGDTIAILSPLSGG